MKKTTQTNSDTVNLTPDQVGIAERVAAQDTDWFSISEESMTDFSLMNNQLNIDPNYPVAAALERDKKYVFRWCTRNPNRIDELTRSSAPPLRWAIVNRQTLPEMESSVDPLLGCVCCLDQILLFKPYAHAEIVRRAKNEMADAKAKTPELMVSADNVEVSSGEQNKIIGSDVIEYTDDRMSDLVVDE